MNVRIYQPTKTAMQSGKANTQQWVLEYEPQNTRFIDPLMGWTGNADTSQQLRLTFASMEEAVHYAKHHNLQYQVTKPKKAKLKKQAYADNFKG